MKDFRMMLVFLIFNILFSLSCTAQSSYNKLAYGFEHPQDSTRTKVWWFHGETPTARTGIMADLKAFRQQGVGGVVYYDQVHGDAKGACPAFSPDWWSSLIFASQEAKRLGLTFEVHVSNGYVAGGPWITPALGMQRLTSTDTIVSGGRRVTIALPKPQAAYNYYKDVAVLAIPLSEAWDDSRSVRPSISCSETGIPVTDCFDRVGQLTVIPAQNKGKSVYITMDFQQSFTARCLQYELGARGKATTSATNVPGPPAKTFVGTGYRVLPSPGQLEVSNDGVHYKKVCDLQPIYKAHSNWKQKTIAFPAVTGRFFRLSLHDWYEADERNKNLKIGNIVLSARAKVDQWEEKAGLYSEYIETDATPVYAEKDLIKSNQLVDLTNNVSDGILSWEAPQGKWAILRFSYVLTGVKTKHGRKNLMGLECDKLSTEAATVQWNHYFKAIMDTLHYHKGLISGMAMDSHEAGSQNWTPRMEQEFKRLRGYDMRKFLPVMAGYIVDSKEQSDGFLYDLRRTIADLISYKYYGTFQTLCDSAGVSFTAQAIGNALCIVGDEIQAKGQVQKPQGEFWAIHPDGNYDIKESSSAAHLYGKTIASAEAFTDARYDQSLAYLKSLADAAYSYGVNEFVVCASAHQPWSDRIPGNTAGGRQYCLNRNNTFWSCSKGFWDYQSRCAYVLRQGRSVNDLCVYLGENAPVKILTYRLPEIPKGFDFDACTSDALFRMDTLSYKMLVLPENRELTLKALRKIISLIENGAAVYGASPLKTGSFLTTAEKSEYNALVRKLWPSPSQIGINLLGKGRVLWGMSLADALQQINLPPDISLPASRKCYFAHRSSREADVYFIHNHEDSLLVYNFTFRSRRKQVELWNPVTGRRFRIENTTLTKDGVSIPLTLQPWESFFVVLTDMNHVEIPVKRIGEEMGRMNLSGTWQVVFDEAKGGPGIVDFPKLTDWTLSADKRIKYYSGTAVYKKAFRRKKIRTNEHVLLQFDKLGALAHVFVNGQQVGTVWCSPYNIDVTNFLKTGSNQLEIHVTNSLINRMIGDAGLPVAKRITFATTPLAEPNDKLVPSGIIGKVQLIFLEK